MSYKTEQVRDAYDASALNYQGLKGHGQTVAILADSSNGYSQQAIDDFDKHNNLIPPTITTTDVRFPSGTNARNVGRSVA